MIVPLLLATLPAAAIVCYRPVCVLQQEKRGSRAGAAVSNTFELLETILLLLPMQDILLAQRTSKHFKSVIGNSLPLQSALCFAPGQPSRAHDPTLKPVLNPLLLLGKIQVISHIRITKQVGFRIWKADKGLYQANEELMRIIGNGSCVWHLRHHHLLPVSDKDEESWRRILVTQPPSDVELGIEGQKGRLEMIVVEGAKMGDVVGESRRRLGR